MLRLFALLIAVLFGSSAMAETNSSSSTPPASTTPQGDTGSKTPAKKPPPKKHSEATPLPGKPGHSTTTVVPPKGE
jgi:hypothetical protein